jgi:formylglycine-generating enzyme required for sulfatase activity
MTTIQRDALDLTGKDAARGLQIFNTTTKCVETWNGSKWIEACPPEGPAESPISPSSETSVGSFCGITASNNNCTFTAAADPDAVAYEFFLSGTSQGIQSSNSITFDETVTTTTDVTVKYYYPPSFLKPEMLPVAGNASWSNNTEKISVNIPSFKMSKTEVTQAQFEYVMGKNESYFGCGNNDNNSYAKKGNATSALPVETVNWYGAITYCNKLSLKENKTPCYSVKDAQSNEIDWEGSVTIPTSSDSYWNAAYCDFSKDGYRLPTDSEWEYAARGKNGADTYTYAGSDDICAVAWYSGNNNTTSDCAKPCESVYGPKPVKMKTANNLDLCDMSGNVWEWTWSGDSDVFPAATPSNAVQASSPYCGLRGGRWDVGESNCRVSDRFNDVDPSDWYSDIGFRVAASIVP